MEFTSPLTEAILLRRYKRFLADVAVTKTDRRTIYCPNTGAMRGCNVLGSRIWFSTNLQTRRKYPDTWEIAEVDGGHLVSINTQTSNNLVLEGLEEGIITDLQGYEKIERDVSIPSCHNRFDFKLSEDNKPLCFVEVKTVTLGDEIHRGFYPDVFNEHASRMLKDLIHIKQMGHRAVLLYCVQHTGIDRVFPADHIDARFGKTLREAFKEGVEIYAYRVDVSLKSINIDQKIEVCIPSKSYGTQYTLRG